MSDEQSLYCHDCRNDSERMRVATVIDKIAPTEINETATCAGSKCEHSQRGIWWFLMFPLENDE